MPGNLNRYRLSHEQRLFTSSMTSRVSRVGHVGLVGLVGALGSLHERRMRPLHVVHDHRSRGYVGEQGVLDPLGGGLAVTADHGDDVLEGVDGDGDADLALGQALF